MINIAIKRLAIMIMIILGIAVIGASHAYAVDRPHTSTLNPDYCTNCHTSHISVGGNFTKVKGNSNVCLQCHVNSGVATTKTFVTNDEAFPGPGTITTPPVGSSHRWDSGPGGYVPPTESHTSSGNILSGVTVTAGVPQPFSGTSPRIYKITIAASPGNGDVSTAKFDWVYSDDGGTNWLSGNTSVLTGQDVPLNNNIKITFINGTSPSFIAGDIWTIRVRPQINYPTTNDLARRMFIDDGVPKDIPDVTTGDTYAIPGSSYGKASCSTCHNQHNQGKKSFDPLSPTTYTSGTTEDRHLQRIDNNTNQMCLDCHSARIISSVRTYTGSKLSHPVGVDFPSTNTKMHAIPREPNPSTTVIFYSGSATTNGTSTQLTDTSNPWGAADLKNLYIRFTSGTNAEEYREISTNTTTTVSWTTSLPNIVAAGDAYVIEVVQSAKATSGKATSGTTLCMTDTNKTPDFDSTYQNLYIYFLPRYIADGGSAVNPHIGKRIISASGKTICWATEFTNSVGIDDPYVIDADGNPTNNFRFDNNGTPSFTSGKVYCLTCHGMHWTDSDQGTYDRQ